MLSSPKMLEYTVYLFAVTVITVHSIVRCHNSASALYAAFFFFANISTVFA